MSIWELQDDAINPLDTTAFAVEGVFEQTHLQKVLAKNNSAIDSQLLVIAEEYSAWQDSRRRIDAVALDHDEPFHIRKMLERALTASPWATL